MSMTMKRAAGMTLIEVIIAITVIAMCMTAVLGLLSSIAVRSASSMVSSQSTAIASAYMEEILSKAFTGGSNPPGRQNFDDVRDYNNLVDNGARDHTGAPIAGLGQYRVQVFVTTVQIGAPPDNVQARRVDVRVTGPNGSVVRLLGHRTNYVAQVLHEYT
jgi:MSHA pilin protein MshD